MLPNLKNEESVKIINCWSILLLGSNYDNVVDVVVHRNSLGKRLRVYRYIILLYQNITIHRPPLYWLDVNTLDPPFYVTHLWTMKPEEHLHFCLYSPVISIYICISSRESWRAVEVDQISTGEDFIDSIVKLCGFILTAYKTNFEENGIVMEISSFIAILLINLWNPWTV